MNNGALKTESRTLDLGLSNSSLYRDATPIFELSCKAALNSLQFPRHTRQDPELGNPA